MKVRATKMGFYRGRKRPGAEFDLIDAKDFSGNWMEKADAPKKSPGRPRKDEPKALSDMAAAEVAPSDESI